MDMIDRVSFDNIDDDGTNPLHNNEPKNESLKLEGLIV